MAKLSKLAPPISIKFSVKYFPIGPFVEHSPIYFPYNDCRQLTDAPPIIVKIYNKKVDPKIELLGTKKYPSSFKGFV